MNFAIINLMIAKFIIAGFMIAEFMIAGLMIAETLKENVEGIDSGETVATA